MRNKHLLLLLCSAILLCSGLAAAGEKTYRIALLHRPKTNFAREMQAFSGREDWQVTGFSVEELENLSARLKEFDLVAVGSLDNRESKTDFARYGEAWRDFVSSGGTLLLLDANYPEALGAIIGHFGAGYGLTPEEGCVQYSQTVLHAPPAAFTSGDALLEVPNHLKTVFAEKRVWAHLIGFDSVWRVPVKCTEGKGVFAWRDYGKGLVIVTAWGGLNTSAGCVLLRALAENVSVFAQCRQRGFALERFSVSPALAGAGSLSLALAEGSAQGTKIPYALSLVNNGENILERTGELAAGEELRADYFVQAAGELNVRLELGAQSPVRIGSVRQVPEAFRLSRSVLYPAISRNARFVCALSADTLADKTNRYFLILDGRETEIPAPSGGCGFDAAKLAPGAHGATLSVRNGLGEAVLISPERPFTVRERNPDTYVDERGRLCRAGEPFFPVGIYHVIPREGMESQREFLDYASSSGFDFVHVSGQLGENLPAFLAYAAEKKLLVITEHVDAPRIAELKNNPAVLGWNVGDEPEVNNRSVADMQERYAKFKDADGGHPLYTVLASIKSVAGYSVAADIVAHDCYPVPDRPIQEVYANLSYVVKSLGGGASPFSVVQSQGYPGDGKHFGPKRVPTPLEVRNMTCQSLLAGVKGVIFYTYNDTYGGVGFNLTEYPQLMREVAQLPAFIHQAAPYILKGEFTRLDQAEDLLACTWSIPEGRLLIAVNCRPVPAEMVLDLPHAGLAPVFGEAEDYSDNGGKLRLRLAPQASLVAFLK